MPAEPRITADSPQKSGAGWREREASLVELARRQHDVISTEQLRGLGFAQSTIRDRCGSHRLHRIHSGVYALGRPDLPAKGRWMAAVLACGPGALLSHASAAALHGIRASNASRVDVTVRRGSSIARSGIRVHQHFDLTAADVAEIDGIPVTSLPRTLLDLATMLSEDQLERACDQAVVEGVFDMRAMSELLGRSHGRRGVRKLRAVLARGDLGANMPASGLERRFRRLCRDAGLPPPEINRYILLGDEYHKVDFLWRKERVVIEVDGGKYHSTGWQRRRDAERDALLRAHGYGAGRIPEDAIESGIATATRLLAAAR